MTENVPLFIFNDVCFSVQVFKITLNSPNNHAPDLSVVRDQVYEAAHKVWLHYVDMERKATYKVPWELHNQLQSVSSYLVGRNGLSLISENREKHQILS